MTRYLRLATVIALGLLLSAAAQAEEPKLSAPKVLKPSRNPVRWVKQRLIGHQITQHATLPDGATVTRTDLYRYRNGQLVRRAVALKKQLPDGRKIDALRIELPAERRAPAASLDQLFSGSLWQSFKEVLGVARRVDHASTTTTSLDGTVTKRDRTRFSDETFKGSETTTVAGKTTKRSTSSGEGSFTEKKAFRKRMAEFRAPAKTRERSTSIEN